MFLKLFGFYNDEILKITNTYATLSYKINVRLEKAFGRGKTEKQDRKTLSKSEIMLKHF
jgi:hypothetical protein